MAPTAVAVVERAVAEWNRQELQGLLAREFDRFAIRPLELTDFRSVGDSVVARDGERTLVFTVLHSRIAGLALYQPGDEVPELLRAPAG